jgi:hypothetical protein
LILTKHPRLRSGIVNLAETMASASLGRRLRPPSEVEVIMLYE